MVLYSLLTGATGNGDGPIYGSLAFSPDRRTGSTIYAYGTFGGATVTLYASPDSITWLPIPSGVLTAPGIVNIDLTANNVKATVTGATGTTNINIVGC